MLQTENENGPLEILTSSPDDPALQRWLQRAISSSGERLGSLRDRVMSAAQLTRHSVVLDLRAGAGLLTWEALRQAPEGGVVALARTARDADALREMAQRLPEASRPMVLQGALSELPMLLQLRAAASDQASPTRFDAIVGYNALLEDSDKSAALHMVATLLAEQGALSFAERIPRHTQRIHRLVDADELGDKLAQRWREAEEAIYTTGDAMVGWDEDDVVSALREDGLDVEYSVEEESAEMQVTPSLIARWFGIGREGKPSYGEHLRRNLSLEEVEQVRALLERRLLGEVVRWGSRTLHLVARRV
jgi:putative ATPase